MAKTKHSDDTPRTPRTRTAAPRRSPARRTTPAAEAAAASAVHAPTAPGAAPGDTDVASSGPVHGAEPSYLEIAEAAYLRYLQRGASHGRDFDDWLEAERELRSRYR